MPSVQITDRLGVKLDAELAPASTLVKYARGLPGLILHGGDVSQLRILKLGDSAVQSLSPSLSFQQPVGLGAGGPQLTIGADAGVSFRVICQTPENTSLFDDDDYGDDIEIPSGTCYLALGVHAGIDAGVEGGSGALTFGMTAGGSLALESYWPFSAGVDSPTVADALRQALADLVFPAGADDLAAMPPGVIVTVKGAGSLGFSATADLVAVANPLATLALPSPAPELAITRTGSVSVGASWQISSEHQVRVQKLDARTVRLGWYRKRGSDFEVTASASAGIQAGTESADLLSSVVGALSTDADADLETLEKEGLSQETASEIREAVQAAVDRKLQLAIAAGFGSLAENEAAFLYEVDLGALDDTGKEALRAALAGDLSRLSHPDRLPSGITEVHSILSKVRATQLTWRVNLLGIFNFGSISKLALNGTVTYAPSTGDLVISDEATASRIRTASVNFGADEDKLRHVLAESFLITAAYRGSRTVLAQPELSSSHVFFQLDDNADRSDIRRWLAVAGALGLEAAPAPAGIDRFGRTAVVAEARYDNAAAESLFLNDAGEPRAHVEFELAGRRAVAMLVLPDGDDRFRLGPATDDQLWRQMSSEGPANFARLMPKNVADGVRPDYLAIQWWADTMRGTGEILAEMKRAGPTEDLRRKLARHLRDVAAKAHEQFGMPWGLVAMFLACGRRATSAVRITGSRFVFAAGKALAAGT